MLKNMDIRNIWLVINYVCNNKCIWCYEEGQIAKTMSKKLSFEIINFLSELEINSLNLIGGEPTLHPNISEIINYSKNKGISPSLVTNGRKLSDKSFLENLVNSGMKSVGISIEGFNQETHDSITKVKGSYQETIKGIENCVEMGVHTITTTTICKENIDYLENIIDVLSEIGIKDIGFNVCTPSPNTKNESSIGPKEASKLIEVLYLYGKEKDVRIKSVTPLPICNINSEIREEMLSQGLLNKFCQMYTGSGFAIDPEGEILPCVHWPEHSIGSILENGSIIKVDKFLKFLESPEELPFKLRSSLLKYPSQKCVEDTKYWGDCIGGCPLFWIYNEPSKEIKGIPKSI